VAQRILVVEDDRTIATALVERLVAEGFDVELAVDGRAALDAASRQRPDLVVLDLMLPELDGLEVCRRLQATHHQPVLMLTARDDEADLLVGLAVGADDYIVKPFSMREVVARIRAILRRVESGRAAPERTIEVGDIRVDIDRRAVAIAGQSVALTPTEFELVVTLMRRPGVVFSREQLLVDVWGYPDGFGRRTVDSHVRALRRKLGDGVIRTVHGVGYAFADEDVP
jgi:DNA-binding response OmpR family regulator